MTKRFEPAALVVAVLAAAVVRVATAPFIAAEQPHFRASMHAHPTWAMTLGVRN